MCIGASKVARGLTVVLLVGVVASAKASDVRLTEAVKSGDYEKLRVLLTDGADVNEPEGDGATALHWAVRNDDVEAVELLLHGGADANAENDYGVTALFLACVNRNVTMVERLLSAGADPNAATLMGETALMSCTRTGSLAAVTAILDHAENDLNAMEVSRGQTALMWAAAKGYPDVVRLLLERGADVHVRTQTRSLLVSLSGRLPSYGDTGAEELQLGGFTPLLFAAREGSVDSARILLDAGADVNETAPDGASALVVASFSGHGELAALLLERGADMDARAAGYAALHTAVLRSDVRFVKKLLAYGADPNIRITKGSRVPRSTNWWVLPKFLVGGTPYLLAAKYAELEIMRILTSHGADPFLATEDGTTPLMMAAGARWRNREVDRRNRAVPTEIAEAMHANDGPNLEATTLALELGADVNIQNRAGDTALHSAVYKAWPSIVEFLVEHGGSLDIKNKSGTSPRDAMCYGAGQLIQCPDGLRR